MYGIFPADNKVHQELWVLAKLQLNSSLRIQNSNVLQSDHCLLTPLDLGLNVMMFQLYLKAYAL